MTKLESILTDASSCINWSESTFLNDYYTDDVYSFNISNTSSINLNLHNISVGDDADLYLYADSNNNGVFDANDQQLQSSERYSNSDDSINYLASAGNYFAQVVRYAPGSSGQLDYTLDLSATPEYPYPAYTEPPNLLPVEFDGGVLSSGNTYTNYNWVGNTTCCHSNRSPQAVTSVYPCWKSVLCSYLFTNYKQ